MSSVWGLVASAVMEDWPSMGSLELSSIGGFEWFRSEEKWDDLGKISWESMVHTHTDIYIYTHTYIYIYIYIYTLLKRTSPSRERERERG